MDGSPVGGSKRPAHARRGGLTKATEGRLAELGRQLPPPGEEARRIIAADRRAWILRRLVSFGIVVLVVALGAAAVAQWVRPLPAPALQVPPSVRLPGSAPTLPWPSAGEAALSVEGAGSLGQLQGAKSVPVASLIDVLTAYVILHDHPLAPGGDGPVITVNADTASAYQAGVARQESEIPVAAGETLSELEALEGLLVASGADMATLLADWDAGSVGAFVAKMNATASVLGLGSTHVTDPSGVDPGTTSTAEDLVGLGQAAMSVPVLRQIVSLGEVQLPTSPLVYNLDFDLGRDGIIGIKTGSDAAAGGGYLFAAQQVVGGKPVTVVGAVLGQTGANGPNTVAVDAGDALVKAAFATLHEFVLFPAGQAVGQLVGPWGASTAVTAAGTVSVLGWPGLTVPLATHLHAVTAPVAAGSVVGVLRAGAGGTQVSMWLRTAGKLSGPSAWWRLSR